MKSLRVCVVVLLLLGLFGYAFAVSLPRLRQSLEAAPPPKAPMAVAPLPTNYSFGMDLAVTVRFSDGRSVAIPTCSNKNGTWGGGPTSGYNTGIDCPDGTEFRLTVQGGDCSHVFRKAMNGDVTGDYAFRADETFCSCVGATSATVSEDHASHTRR